MTDDYVTVAGGRVYCVNGPQQFGGHKVQVFELDFATGQLLATFSPNNQVSSTRMIAEYYSHE